MRTQTIIWIVGVLIVVAGASYWMISSRSPVVSGNQDAGYAPTSGTANTSGDAVVAVNANSSGTVVTGAASATYTSAEVAAHAGMSSCWSIIDGNVYDLTSWISQHPGGERAILSLCGKDGSAAFHGQHGDAKKQADILATMKIGVLAR